MNFRKANKKVALFVNKKNTKLAKSVDSTHPYILLTLVLLPQNKPFCNSNLDFFEECSCIEYIYKCKVS